MKKKNRNIVCNVQTSSTEVFYLSNGSTEKEWIQTELHLDNTNDLCAHSIWFLIIFSARIDYPTLTWVPLLQTYLIISVGGIICYNTHLCLLFNHFQLGSILFKIVHYGRYIFYWNTSLIEKLFFSSVERMKDRRRSLFCPRGYFSDKVI